MNVLVVGFLITIPLLVLVLIKLSAKSGGFEGLRDELRSSRDDARTSSRELREEVGGALKGGIDTLSKTLGVMGSTQETHTREMTRTLQELIESNQRALEQARQVVDERMKQLQQSNETKLDAIRAESERGMKQSSDGVKTILEGLAKSQDLLLGNVSEQLKSLVEGNQTALNGMRDTLDARVKELHAGNETKLGELRTDLTAAVSHQNQTLSVTLQKFTEVQQTELQGVSRELKEMVQSNQTGMERIRGTLDGRVLELQNSNEKRLEEMRRTVDEKLHETLERRLGESFKMVSDRLDAVHKGLGEMQTLANGVGDLKRVLTNVKARGTWAEVQLEAILDQILTREQYEKNVKVKPDSAERVEFAIRLPGQPGDPDTCVWLPIDSKFPQEDYSRLQEAADRADQEKLQSAVDNLLRAVRLAAKDISEKYISPPHTTDFAIMFLATEGLYAEVVRQPGFVEELQQRYRITVAGPTTLSAFLCSVRMGFQTILIQRHADDVWKVLGAVKTEFGKFGAVLGKVKRQLDTASRSIEDTEQRTRMMEKRLRSVDGLPEADAAQVLKLMAPEGEVTAQQQEQHVLPEAS
jgi:DNA recombination protein RmuC